MVDTKTLILTTVFSQLNDAWYGGKRRFFVEGGTASSKTWSVMQFLKILLENYKEPVIATVTSESVPHLKRGAIRDFLSIMGDELIDKNWNRSDFIYTFPNGCLLEFVSADQPVKLKGGRREILFCNEANNIARDSFREADMRTRLFTICDWNPVSEFWFHDEEWGRDVENVYLQGITYRDTPEVVSRRTIEDIERYKDRDPNWYRVYGMGLLGKLEGLVYPHFEQVDELPKGDVFYGLDYGFSSDPTVLIKNVIMGENLYSQEMFYDDSALTNDDIARRMSLCKVGGEIVWADRDEPKSAEELTRLGFNVQAVDKAYANVAFGIKKVNSYKQHWTKDSSNCIKEQRNHRYIEDKKHPGMFTEQTTHRWSHGMDARRYALSPHIDKIGGSSGIITIGW